MAVAFLDFEQPIAELEAKIEELKHVGSDSEVNIEDEIGRLQAKSRQLTVSIFASLTPWQITQLARHPHRPYTLDYVAAICSEFYELHGDRMYADDGAIVGGLGIGVCDRLLMLQYSTYSVISPEGCASILWKSQDKKEVAADSLNLTADRLHKLGLVDEIIEEPLGGAHRDPAAIAASLKAVVVRYLNELAAIPAEQLRAARAAKIASFGVFSETAA